MTTVILAEKPDQARSYAAVFKQTTKQKGYITINDSRFFKGEAIMTWGIGHLVELCLPGHYKKEWKRWNLANLPILPSEVEFQVPASKQEQFRIVRSLLKKASLIIIATDPDREGENIARSIMKQAGVRSDVPIKRLWINSQENDVVREGFLNLQPGEKFEPMYEEAKARQVADWLVGMNASPLYSLLLRTKGIQDTFSVGRVQTPTLYLIYLRQKEIEAFVSKPFFELKAKVEAAAGTFQAAYKHRLKTKEDVSTLMDKHGIKGKTASTIAELGKKNKEMPSPLLHSLATLQASANRKWKYSPSKVLSVVQRLYEKKWLTYPRTESNHITNAEFTYLRKQINQYQQLMEQQFEPAFLFPRKRYVDDAKVQEHYAIIPTKKVPTPLQLEKLKPDEKNLYLEVLRTTLAMFAPTYKYEETKVTVDINGLPFHTTGKVEQDIGWKVLFPYTPTKNKKSDEPPVLPPLQQGEGVMATVKATEGKTQPPPLYTEGQLIPLMKTAGKFVEDEEEQAVLNEVTGIGTGATRASIIETLKNREYMTIKQNKVHVTEKGRILCQAVEGNLLSKADMTAQWELFLRKIGQGEKDGATFIGNIHAYIHRLLKDAPGHLQTLSIDTSAITESDQSGVGPCPLCGGAVLSRGPVYACSKAKENSCKFVIVKTLAKKKLTDATVKRLLTKGETAPLRGFKSKQGKSFSAALTLKEGKIEFDFTKKPTYRKTNGKRPAGKRSSTK
ncbi:DNA topoisomerase 3 [Shouchella sp. 1P09AA]|uniref:type IA DNA topoisomerase n=1 Tax=unclassified Shouchella TaxID=2893065 RepID=UPI0039A1B3E5